MTPYQQLGVSAIVPLLFFVELLVFMVCKMRTVFVMFDLMLSAPAPHLLHIVGAVRVSTFYKMRSVL